MNLPKARKGGKQCKCQAQFAATGKKCKQPIEPNEKRIRVPGDIKYPNTEAWQHQTLSFHMNAACVNARLNPDIVRISRSRPGRFPSARPLTEVEKAASGLQFC